MGRPPHDIEERFWSKVEKGPGCWEWMSTLNGSGYGTIWDNSRHLQKMAHRLSWEIHYGPVLASLGVLHRCDNPPCVRPDHLFLGTCQDNMQDASSKGRTARGERHPKHRLTVDQVREIRRRLARGEVQERLAAEFGITQGAVGHINNGRSWAWLDAEGV
ncbi:MAG: HNH endonuclease [Planctomycetota bacterium]